MGRAIDMENDIQRHGQRLSKLEGAVEEVIGLLNSIMKEIGETENKGSSNVKKKTNNKRTK